MLLLRADNVRRLIFLVSLTQLMAFTCCPLEITVLSTMDNMMQWWSVQSHGNVDSIWKMFSFAVIRSNVAPFL